MKKILNKKVLGVLLAVMMLFSLSAPAFATGETATVKVYVPEYFIDDNTFDYVYTDIDSATGYSYAGYGEDIMGDPVAFYSYTSSAVDYSVITGMSVTPPVGFVDKLNGNPNLPYFPSVFDVIYKAIVTVKGETPYLYDEDDPNDSGFVYGFVTPYYDHNYPYGRADYVFINTISDLPEYVCYEYHPTPEEIALAGEPIESIWSGYVFHLYCVPSWAANTFDPLAPDSTYLADYQSNNIMAEDGFTYYLIYEYDFQTYYE